MGCKDTKAISLPLPGYPQNRGSLVHSQKYLLHEVQIKGRSAESVPVRVSPQRCLARPAGSWQDRISFSGRVFSFQGSVATEYHVQTPKAIHLGTVSCEDGFARYFCKNDTFILRYIAFYWLFGILKNFRHFSRFWGREAGSAQTKTAPPAKGQSFDRQRRCIFICFQPCRAPLHSVCQRASCFGVT